MAGLQEGKGRKGKMVEKERLEVLPATLPSLPATLPSLSAIPPSCNPAISVCMSV
jgi:hypothetical protein